MNTFAAGACNPPSTPPPFWFRGGACACTYKRVRASATRIRACRFTRAFATNSSEGETTWVLVIVSSPIVWERDYLGTSVLVSSPD